MRNSAMFGSGSGIRVSHWLLLLPLALSLGCNDYSPTAPDTPPPPPPVTQEEVYVSGLVYEGNRKCVPEATVIVYTVNGPRPPLVNDCTQTHGRYYGYLAKDLRNGDRITVEASREGYIPQKISFIVNANPVDGVHADVDFLLQKK